MINWIKLNSSFLIILVIITLSVGAWAVFYSLGLTTVYNDAMSHLNVARLVFDNLQPGLSQLGSVWLPLSHILTLPFIWIDPLWRSGLAGSLISMIAFIASIIGVYKITLLLSESRIAGVISASVLALNINMLYLQSTPLTEPLFVGLFVLSILYLVKYLKYRTTSSLIALSLISALGILTRYDGWFISAIIALIIFLNEYLFLKSSLKATIGYLSLYAFPILFAASLWLGWNLLIFGDPLYSFTGPYSARAQQATIEASSGLITKHNFLISTSAYSLTMLRNIGLSISILGVIGWITYLWLSKNIKISIRIFTFTALFSIIIFNVLALYLGFSIINLPELGWNPSGTRAGEMFNVRYGILALPFMAIGLGLLVSRLKKLQIIGASAAASIIILQLFATHSQGVIAIEDGTTGSSAFVNQDIAGALKESVRPGERVIMSTSSYNAVAFESGLNLKSFIHEGVSAEWNGAITQPDLHGEWLVIANNDIGEPIHTSLIKNQDSAFLKNYTKTYTGTYASLYRLNN